MSDILVKIGADITQFSRAMAESQRKLTEFNNKNKETFDSFRQAGATVTAVSATFAAGLFGAVKTAASFEAEMSKVKAISGATADDLAQLTDKAKEMGAMTKFSASESAEAFQYMAMAGWKTTDMLDGIEGIMSLAAASGEDLALTSDIVTDALTAFGMTAKDSGRFADVLAAASSNANTNVAMLGESFKYVAPVAGALGMSAEDTSIALGLMANAGIKSSQAGTSLRTMLTNLSSPTKAMRDAMDELGLSLTDSEGNVKSLDQIMKDMRGTFSKLTDAQQAQYASTIFGKEAMSGALSIINASASDYEKLTAAINSSEGAANKMAAEMEDNLLGSITSLKSAFEGLMIGIGDPLKDTIRSIADSIRKVLTWFNGLSESTKKTISIITAITTALGLIAGPLLLLIGFIPQIIVGFQALGTVFAAVTGPVGLTIAAIVGVIAALVLAYNKVEWFRDMVNDAWAWIKEASIVAFEAVRDFVILAVEEIVAFVQPILEKFRNFWDVNGRQILDIIKLYFGLVWEHIKFVIGHIKALFEMIWPIISGAVQIAWGSIKFVVESTLDYILGFIQTILAILRGDWEGAWETIKDTVKNIWDNIKEFFEGVDLVQIGKDIIAGLISGMSSMVENVKEGVKSVGTKIVDTFKGWLKIKSPSRVMMALAKHIPGGAIKGMESMHGKLKSATARMADAMTPEVSQISMDYATPSGIHSSLASAINGTVDVNAREDIIAGAIDNLNRKLDTLRIEMNEREMGRFVSDVSTEGRNQAVRNGGRRRI